MWPVLPNELLLIVNLPTFRVINVLSPGPGLVIISGCLGEGYRLSPTTKRDRKKCRNHIFEEGVLSANFLHSIRFDDNDKDRLSTSEKDISHAKSRYVTPYGQNSFGKPNENRSWQQFTTNSTETSSRARVNRCSADATGKIGQYDGTSSNDLPHKRKWQQQLSETRKKLVPPGERPTETPW